MADRTPIIYNLFPRHYATMDSWSEPIKRIKSMGFTAVYVNPFHEPGMSGSLYSIRDYFKLNKLFLKDGTSTTDFTPLKKFIAACKSADLDLIMDLVINHTAIDSPLVAEHPSWFKRDGSGKVQSPFAIDPGDPGKITVWGDLASINNEHASDQDALWGYWDNLVRFYQDMGIMGFRCDAAYQVPANLWRWLIAYAKQRYPQSRFYAETLGCRLDQIEALHHTGFDYLFNSVKWWHYDQGWALDQHQANKPIAPSIAFPESHDTERLAGCHPGTIAVQKSRYAFAALFSKGVLMPMGYEYGAKKRMDVVRGTPSDVEQPQWDLGPWLAKINALKQKIPVLAEEGSWRPISDYNRAFLFLQKSSDYGNWPVCVCVNKDPHTTTFINRWEIPEEVKRCSSAVSLCSDMLEAEQIPQELRMAPGEIWMFN